MPTADTLIAERYRLLALVGTSETSKAWRALDERLQREVAVKTVNLDLLEEDPGTVAHFRREVEASAALTSPYVVATFDSGLDHEFAYVVMELLSGPSLTDLLRADAPLDWTRALALGADIARGLADAHAAGVAHGNLSPDTVLLNDETAKIVGLEVSPPVEPARRSADLAALGGVLFALFAGRAHAGASAAGAFTHAARPRLRDYRPDAPAPLDALVAALLGDPDDRPPAATVARELAQLRDQRAVTEAAPTTPLPTSSFAHGYRIHPRRRRGLTLLSWLVTLVLAGVLAVVAWVLLGQPGPRHPSPAPTPPPVAQPSPSPSPTVPTLGVPPTP